MTKIIIELPFIRKAQFLTNVVETLARRNNIEIKIRTPICSIYAKLLDKIDATLLNEAVFNRDIDKEKSKKVADYLFNKIHKLERGKESEK